MNNPNYLKWKVDQNNNCRPWWVEQTWYSKLFNLKSFRVHNTRVKVLFFHLTKFDLVQTCSNETLNDLRLKNYEYQVWSSQQDLQLIHSSFSHLRKFYQTLVINSWISYRLSETMSQHLWNLNYILFKLSQMKKYPI